MRTPLCFLLLMASLCSGHVQQGLQCYSDLFRNITCEWDGVLQTGQPVDPQSKCTLKATWTLRNRLDAECDLIRQDGKIWRCVLHFPRMRYFSRVHEYALEASCENYSKPAVRLASFRPFHKSVKLPPPEEPAVVNKTISWKFTHPGVALNYKFELQYKSDGQTWEKCESIEICCKATNYQLQQDLKQGQRYFTRVRVILDGDEVKKKMWSEWSPIASWETPADVTPTVGTEEVESWLIWWAVVGALAVLVFLVALMFMGSRMIKPLLIPDPSKYFDGLDSVHKGNFKTWLGSFIALDALTSEQQFEYISPVEVLKAQVCSSFNNNRYFYGSDEGIKCPPPPPSGPLEPCQEFSPYDHMLANHGSGVDANVNKVNSIAGVPGSNSSISGLRCGTLGTLQLCPSYKDLTCLRAEAQSPDSGFSMGSMEEEEEEVSLEATESEISNGKPDERVPLEHQGGTFRGNKVQRQFCSPLNIEWSLFKTPLPPLSPRHCSVPFLGSCQGPEHCSTPKGLTPPEDSLDGPYGELEPSSDDYMPL